MQEIFRSADGRGMKYDDYGESFACAICRDQGVWARHNLIRNIRTVPGARHDPPSSLHPLSACLLSPADARGGVLESKCRN